MATPRKRDLVKAAIRLHSSFDGPSLEDAARQVGLEAKSLRYFRRRRDWGELCREVAQESLNVALPIAIRRLIDAARTDKSSSGVTAAKTLVDVCRGDDAEDLEAQDAVSDGIDFEKLTKEERDFACRLLARLQRQKPSG